MSQNQAILNYLKSGNTLTGLEALKLFGTMKLASRVSELRADGHNIQDRTIHNKETNKHYSEYWYSQEPPRTEHEEMIAQDNLRQETIINTKEVNRQREFVGAGA